MKNQRSLVAFTRAEVVMIYILNVTDVFFTLYLLSTGLGKEMNPFMVGIMGQPLKAIIFKTVIVGLAALLAYIVLGKLEKRNLRVKKWTIIITIILLIYIFINGIHVSNTLWILNNM